MRVVSIVRLGITQAFFFFITLPATMAACFIIMTIIISGSLTHSIENLMLSQSEAFKDAPSGHVMVMNCQTPPGLENPPTTVKPEDCTAQATTLQTAAQFLSNRFMSIYKVFVTVGLIINLLFLPTKPALRRAFDNASQHVAMAKEAHAHYSEPFGAVNAVRSWLSGFLKSFWKSQ
ncbi:hypothetical protein CBW54_09510 [Yersinia kristensenii]|nr:hypothetical protein CBW54_09510 [Yersinia kristensenii]